MRILRRELSQAQNRMLAGAIDKPGLAGQALYRILKAARTIADLEGADAIGDAHLLEPIAYRTTAPGV